MTTPKSIKAYGDCAEKFDEALASERGIAVTFATRPEATGFMQKMNTYRTMLRKQNRQVYPPDHPSHGTSPYDHFQLTRDKENECRVLIRPYQLSVIGVEKL